MKNFRLEAKRVVSRHTSHRANKITAKKMRKIASVGTERIVRQCLCNYLKWCDENDIHPDMRGNKQTLSSYLEERMEWVQQKTLDQERQSLQQIYQQQLPFFQSLQESVYSKRSYTLAQVDSLVKHQTIRNLITTWLSFFSGIRAHEAATILPINEQTPSAHREWDARRFTGLPTNKRYTVVGKGGLTREIAVPIWLAEILEDRRRPPKKVVDREVIYSSHYDIGFGQAWSQSVTRACKKALGFSNGGHGLRHSYAKWRLAHLTQQSHLTNDPEDVNPPYEQAMLIVSQELGHFRMDIVFTYLR